jgi:hypothetical protein
MALLLGAPTAPEKSHLPARKGSKPKPAREVNHLDAHLVMEAVDSGFGLESGRLWPRCASGSA